MSPFSDGDEMDGRAPHEEGICRADRRAWMEGNWVSELVKRRIAPLGGYWDAAADRVLYCILVGI